jgi:tRNA threonylcarbamoyladenosine biosynthesis protein TsaB
VFLLAFDTSGFSGSVALLRGAQEGAEILCETTLDSGRRSAQTLAPAIARLLAARQIEPSQIGLVATTTGPGSFTGLRVGVTTAKTLAYAVGAQVLGVSTLEASAHGVPERWLAGHERTIEAVLDAQRKELFVGRFALQSAAEASDGIPHLARLAEDRIVSAEAWLRELAPGTIVTGEGLARIEGRLPAGVRVVLAEARAIRAAIVGRLAWRDFVAGRRGDLWKLAPRYLRPSYAEEKAAGARP